MFQHKTVLTIDDSDTIRAYLRSVLTPKGAVVDSASSGQEGLALCAQREYDLILLDLLMPDIDGIEVLRRIRATNSTSTIVMLTGHGGIKSAMAAIQIGADGYIEKQDIASTIHDHAEFMYALEQAMEHRAGIVAQQQLTQVRSDFYAMVTHDLRNPATLILLAAEMLKDDSSPQLDPRQLEMVNMITEAANRLFALINDYLDFAKIDAGYLRLDLEEVDLRQVVESSAQFIRLQTQARQQTLTLDLPTAPVRAWADAERLKQVLDNLFSNAVKYTPEGGSIRLQLTLEHDQAVFRVSDTGAGIPADQLPTLFTKYHRVKNASVRGVQGTGLGLVIVKEIVGAHGGSIHAESDGVPGQGTTFVFNIPLHPAAQPARPAEEALSSVDSLPAEAAQTLMGGDDEELFRSFVRESQRHIRLLQDMFRQLYRMPNDRQLIEMTQRVTHTLKGNAAAMQCPLIRDLAAQMDDVFRQAKLGGLVLTPERITEMAQLLSQIDLALTTEKNAPLSTGSSA